MKNMNETIEDIIIKTEDIILIQSQVKLQLL